jgi:Holliday junction DNA helicase RuvB
MSDPSNDSGDVRPSSLSHLIGQDHVKSVVSTTLDYCFQDQCPFPHSLMLGPPGVGKTALAKVIAEEAASGFHEVLGSAITSPAEFFSVLMRAQDLDIVFIDEAHLLESAYQHTLLIAIDERRVYLPNSNGNAPQSINLGKFSLIGATTDEHKLIRPLVDRFKLLLRFQYYSVAELAEIVRTRAKGLGWPLQSDVAEPIAQKAKGVPRLAIRLLQSSWRCCRAVGDHVITTEHLERACLLEQIDPLGLDATEQQYLRCLADGPLRLNMLASMLGLPSKTISAVTESYLIRSGLVTKDKQGLRMLTAKGMEHVGVSTSRKVGDQ